MIIDCIMYSGERECLLMRLHELAGVVDIHVVVEATETFTGPPKPLYFARDDAAGYFGEHRARILPYVATLPPDGPWEREAYQRNACMRMLDGVSHNAVVLMGDVDEIPMADAVRSAARILNEKTPQMALEQDLRLYYVNNRCTTKHWRGTQACLKGWLDQVTPQKVRDWRNAAPAILNAGWHFGSLLGDEGAARFERKLASFSHADECKPFATPENVAAAIDEGRDVSGRTDILFRADLTPKVEDYPAWLWQHRRDYPALWHPGTTL